MSTLTLCRSDTAERIEHLADHADIIAKLAGLGVRFERWDANAPLMADAGQAEVLAAYADSVERLNKEYGFQSLDVVALRPDHPEKAELRAKYLNEHIHADFEARFFVDGAGLFYVHLGDQLYMILCEKGDLICVPAGVPHWFDMGAAPDFKCIRFFTTPNGWEADFTGDPIRERFPDFDSYRAGL
ncbi:MAG: cupin [Gammaproteobacteria bacterium]|nr:cupin [Gammaproteobacteria bacterium]MBU1654391.1 cupin [Gammaproteobacteria bacterium]MBU1960232.1 cupin [Gammaproteobacteria bacterium]